MVTKEQVVSLIKAADPVAITSGVHQAGGRVFGEIISPNFATLSVEERKNWIDRVIRVPLGWEGTNVEVLIPLAPGED